MTGRVVLITGGAGGVGQVVSLRWLAEGASVLVADYALPSLEALRAACEAQPEAEPARLATIAADVTTEEGAASLVAEAQRAFGATPDTLLHLVGGFGMGPLDAPDAPQVWQKMMALNLDSAFHCYRAVLPGMRARGGGWIVGLAARAAVTPAAKIAAYAASKAGLIALTQSLAADVRAENIHANVILASTIDTPANRKAMGEKNAADWVAPEDIAEATLYLCSERARSVHGATLEVYGKA